MSKINEFLDLESDIKNQKFKNEKLENINIKYRLFKDCKFENIKMEKVNFNDCFFDNVEISSSSSSLNVNCANCNFK